MEQVVARIAEQLGLQALNCARTACCSQGVDSVSATRQMDPLTAVGWNMRQPEIDALQAEVEQWRQKYEGSWLTPEADPMVLRRRIQELETKLEEQVTECPVCKYWMAETNRLRTALLDIMKHTRQYCYENAELASKALVSPE